MADFNQENNAYPTIEPPVAPDSDYAPRQDDQPVQIEYVYDEPSCGAARFFSLPARVGMWFVGVAVGVTLIFACVIFWIWGLNYLGVIDTDKSVPSGNEFNQSGDDYSEFEEFYDYFDDFFGGIGGSDDGQDEGGTASDSKPGIGVTIQALVLDFVIEDTYSAGLVIVEISEKGALAGTAAQVGDLIVAVNGEACPSFDALDAHIAQAGIGGELTLTLARFINGVASTFDVTITLIDMSTLN